MANLLVSFELRNWVRQGPLIVAAIEELGPATRIFGTTWFVCSSFSAETAAENIQQVMDGEDGLMVLDLARKIVALGNVDAHAFDFLVRHWRDDAAPTIHNRLTVA